MNARFASLSWLLVVAAAGCSSKSSEPAAGSATPSAVAAPTPAPPPAAVTPGVLAQTGVPALAAPDAIEPPSRDYLPGMSIAAALAKGAKPDPTSDTTLKAPAFDLTIDKEAGIVTEVVASYPKTKYAAMLASWAARKLGAGDDYLGANWTAHVAPCTGTDCPVTYQRSPMVLVGAQPVPPLGLASLGIDATAADATKLLGVSASGDHPVATGTLLALEVSETNGHISLIELDDVGARDVDWTAQLAKQWGPPNGSGGVWLSKDLRWAAEAQRGSIRYWPIVAAKDALATVRPLVAKAWRQPKAAVEALPGLKDDERRLPVTELSGDEETDGGRFAVDYDDQGLVQHVHVELGHTSDGTAAALAALTASWGAPVKAKDADGSEVLQVVVDGVVFTVDASDTQLTLDANIPEAK